MAALLDERESRDVNGELELPDRFPPEVCTACVYTDSFK